MELENETNIVLDNVANWINRHQFEPVPEKIEVILLIDKKRCGKFNIDLERHTIKPEKIVLIEGMTHNQSLTGILTRRVKREKDGFSCTKF